MNNNFIFQSKSEINNKRLSLIMGVVSLLTIIGIGYAYFSMTATNDNNEKYSVTTASISLRFLDNDNGVGGSLNLGESIEKKFILENTGSQDAYAKITWTDLVNTYTSESLTYVLKQGTSENGSYTNIIDGNVPITTTPKTKILKNGILVPANTKYYYKLIITLNNLEINQNSDINATFNSVFSLQEGSMSLVSEIQNLTSSVNPNTTNAVNISSPEGETCTNSFAYDGTPDNNLRYVGTNPCNYVTFNGEKSGWRIIGIMNNIDDGTGKLEKRIKLIRTTSLGEYSWDSSVSSIESGKGINDWNESDIMQELNGDYLDSTLNVNTMWYNGQNNLKEALFYHEKKLSETSQQLIDNVKLKIGRGEAGSMTANNFYDIETQLDNSTSENLEDCNYGNCPRIVTWTGKVALMYPSDFGFAVGSNQRNNCLETSLDLYDNNNCMEYVWLKPSSWEWTIYPRRVYGSLVYGVNSTNGIYQGDAYDNVAVRPVVYLKSNVNFSSGNGSISEPYIIN